MKSILWGRKAKIGENVVFVVLFINNKKKHSLSFFSIESLFFLCTSREKTTNKKKERKKEESYKMYGEKQASSALQPFYHLLFFM